MKQVFFWYDATRFTHLDFGIAFLSEDPLEFCNSGYGVSVYTHFQDSLEMFNLAGLSLVTQPEVPRDLDQVSFRTSLLKGSEYSFQCNIKMFP